MQSARTGSNILIMKYQIRLATRKEVDLMVDWARKEGWNPGLHDAECFYAQDTNGFFVGTLNGKIIATVSAVRYDKNYGFMGFYIVDKKYRGKGYGMKLFQRAWKYLGNRNKAGDGVIENLEKYSRAGLKLAHYNARYQGFGTGTANLGLNVTKLEKITFNKIAKYDEVVFGVKRRKFLKHWINQSQSFAYGYVTDGNLLGYGVLRKCFDGYKIGPLFADGPLFANELFNSLTASISRKEKVFIDIPEVNKNTLDIVRKHKMKKVFATGRIYTQGQPKFPLERWYGVTSFELG